MGDSKNNFLEDLREHLTKATVDLGPIGSDHYYGYGLLDPKKLLEMKPVYITVNPGFVTNGVGQ